MTATLKRFFRYQLRTSDVGAARAFYAAVLGGGDLKIVQLHEQAVARGARPHWLGFLHVDDVERAAAEFIQRGATSLGPRWIDPTGLEAAILRDPGGAVIALAKPSADPASRSTAPEVLWHELNTADVARAMTNHSQVLGWEFRPPLELGALGSFHPFAFEVGGPSVGSLADIAGRTGVHPHWLFHFRVAALEPALAAVREGTGEVVVTVTLPAGARIAICHDPQGAAFALREK